MDIPLVHLEFTPGGRSGFPPAATLLASLRRGFLPAFRHAVGCAAEGGGCGAGCGCPCRRVFAQELAADPTALRRYQKPPLPFAFSLQPAAPGGGEDLGLLLFGTAVTHLDLFIAATLELLEPCSAGDLQVAAVAADGGRVPIPSGIHPAEFPSLPLLSLDELLEPCRGRVTEVTIELLSPLRLLQGGAPMRHIPFPPLAGALFRRISSLAYYYGGRELPFDFKWLASLASLVDCSRSELVRTPFGVTGRLTYSGDLEDLLPFLTLGSLLNVGKGAAYGMGSYRLLTT